MGLGMTYPELEERHTEEARALVRSALEAHGWRALAAAGELRVSQARIRRLIQRLGLSEEYERRAPPRGRPKTSK